MIVIISDLHMQHTSLDSIRYRKDGLVRETGVRRNVHPRAFSPRFTEVVDVAAQRHTRTGTRGTVHLVLAGDIFEVHRTPLWFMGSDNDLRPYGQPSEALRDKVRDILRKIAVDNSRFWRALRQFVRPAPECERPYDVKVHYIPGNHDRLLNQWPETRRMVRKLLSMDLGTGAAPAGRPEETYFPVSLPFEDHRVLIRHGHEYESSGENICFRPCARALRTSGPEEYLPPCLGDYLTVDLAARLATAFRARYAVALRQPGGGELRTLYRVLTEFDDVRPMSALFHYMDDQLAGLSLGLGDVLGPVLCDTTEAAAADPFFQKELRRVKKAAGTLGAPLLGVASLLPQKWVAPTFRPLLPFLLGGRPSRPADVAAEEENLGSTFDLVMAGHSHAANQVPMPEQHGQDDQFFVDTGTWRTAILSDPDRRCFGRLRAYTMAFVYTDAERNAPEADGRRFEVWTANLAWKAEENVPGESAEEAERTWTRMAGRAVPYDLVVPGLRPAPCTRELQFTELVVEKIQWEFLGAEISLHLGVDATEASATVEKRGARNGSTFSLGDELDPIPLDPALDGEVWVWGEEVDPVKNDLLPWGLARLKRGARDQQYLDGSGELHLRSRDGTHLVLRYQVRPIRA